ncbi:MAG: 23S rRNA (guanosine(2251)-2'-O)-methyltransferase RlmB [Pseudomonadota bacterium]
MSNDQHNQNGHTKGTRKDTHYAKLRRAHRDTKRAETADDENDRVLLYGLHSVAEALKNPSRNIYQLWVTQNAANRLGHDLKTLSFPVYSVHPKEIDARVGGDAVHQGVLIECDPLTAFTLEDIKDTRLVLMLDQVTDPHNVGALIRSSVAMGVNAIVTTNRHSPVERGVLAKAASGGLEHIKLVRVRNLANAITELNTRGYQTVGLDSDAPEDLETAVSGEKIALVMGAEGKGIRAKTKATVTTLARLDMPGPIRSLNVSNAGALALYVVRKQLSALTPR